LGRSNGGKLLARTFTTLRRWRRPTPGSRTPSRPSALDLYELAGDISGAHLGADGRTVTLSFLSASRPGADYQRAEALEAGSAIAR